MPKINAESVVSDATLSDEPIEPDDLTPAPAPDKPKMSEPIEPDEPKSAKRAPGRNR